MDFIVNGKLYGFVNLIDLFKERFEVALLFLN